MSFDLPIALAVLSAMITPAVLILACASLAISTANRLGRVVDRTRKIAERIMAVTRPADRVQGGREERAELLRQLRMAARRSRLLQLALSCLYLALSGFVATSVAIGAVSLLGHENAWLPILFGVAGIGLLFLASLLLIVDARIAVAAIDAEMAEVVRRCEECPPIDVDQV